MNNIWLSLPGVTSTLFVIQTFLFIEIVKLIIIFDILIYSKTQLLVHEFQIIKKWI